MKATKIICTIGPASETKEQLAELIKKGANAFRFNMSHGTHEWCKEKIEELKELNENLNTHVATILDTKGPEVRTQLFENGSAKLKTGAEVIISMTEVLGNSKKFSVTYPGLINDVEIGNHILIDDGQINLVVKKIDKNKKEIICDVIEGGTVKNHKRINVPDVKLNLDFISPSDLEDILFAIQNDVNFIAASFTQSKENILKIRKILKENGKEDIKIIAKIENREGIKNLDEIIDVSDGIMVARGDLGVEVFIEEVPLIQREIINKCIEKGKISIVATQMLDSMERKPRPTRAEANDVATAVLIGADAVMLSGETAVGKYPVLAVETMAKICELAEKSIDNDLFMERMISHCACDSASAIAESAGALALELDAKAIIALTKSGYTARMISMLRPKTPIIALTQDKKTACTLALNFGVHQFIIPEVESLEDFLSLIDSGYLKEIFNLEGKVVITAGLPFGKKNITNFIKLHEIK